MKRKKKGRIFRRNRSKYYDESRKDTYREQKKLKEPTRCTSCGATFIDGRWSWKETSGETNDVLCPACQRINDNYPAGIVTLSGPFLENHWKEIVQLVRNIHKTEKLEHPMERIIELKDENGNIIVTTTGVHLAQRIGKGLKGALQGELDISFEADNFVRVTWNR